MIFRKLLKGETRLTLFDTDRATIKASYFALTKSGEPPYQQKVGADSGSNPMELLTFSLYNTTKLDTWKSFLLLG